MQLQPEQLNLLTTSEKMWLHWSWIQFVVMKLPTALPHLKRCGSIEASDTKGCPESRPVLTTSEKMWLHWSEIDLLTRDRFKAPYHIWKDVAPLKLSIRLNPAPLMLTYHIWKDVAPLKRALFAGHFLFFFPYHIWKDVAPLKRWAWRGLYCWWKDLTTSEKMRLHWNWH